jgi:hypothetical protein
MVPHKALDKLFEDDQEEDWMRKAKTALKKIYPCSIFHP